jgi:hypothetical protein
MSRFEAGDKVRIIREDSTWSGTLKLYGKIGIVKHPLGKPAPKGLVTPRGL